MTNLLGQIEESAIYDIYGTPIVYDSHHENTTSSLNTLFFSCKEFEKDFGLYYCRARILHPQIGRFTSNDQYLYIDGMNTFSYVRNNPVTNIDLFGESIINSIGKNLLRALEKMAKSQKASKEGMKKLQKADYDASLKNKSIFDYAKENPKKGGYVNGDLLVAGGVLGTIGALAKDILTDPDTYIPPIFGPTLPLGPQPGDPGYCIEYPEQCKDNNPPHNSCDDNDPPCYYDSATGRFNCQISN